MQLPFNIGNILKNLTTDENYGVYVGKRPNDDKLIVFRLDKNTHPVFSKIAPHPQLQKAGHINEFTYAPLKSALLKHYRKHKLTASENKLLEQLMIEAFPLGIPAYNPSESLPERDIKLMDLHSKLQPGSRCFINTPPNSSLNHLNNESVIVIERTPEGLWVVNPNGEDAFSFLFYNNPETPTFTGISRILPYNPENANIDTDNKQCEGFLSRFKDLNSTNNMVSTLNIKGKRIKICPKTHKVLFPLDMNTNEYNPKTDNLITPELNKQDQNQSDLYDDNNFGGISPLTKENILSSIIGGGSNISDELTPEEQSELERLNKNYVIDSDITSELISDDSVSQITKHYIEDDIDAKELLGDNIDNILLPTNNDMTSSRKRSKSTSSMTSDDYNNESNNENDEYNNVYDENELEFVDEDEIETVGTFQKVVAVAVEEADKVYKETTQRNDLFKLLLEKVPRLRRNDERVINKIQKEVNMISLLKHKLTGEDNKLEFRATDYKPLVDKYVSGDFKNKFLIPLVYNKRKVYLDPNGKIDKEEYDPSTNQVIDDFYTDTMNLTLKHERQAKTLKMDAYNATVMSDLQPVVQPDAPVGLLFRFGQDVPTTSIEKLGHETLTIRYCNKPYICQSYPLNTMDFDCQVNLGPALRFFDMDTGIKKKTKALLNEMVNDEDNVNDDMLNADMNIDEEAEANRVDKDIMHIQGRYKIYYEGDNVNIIGFVRPPLKYFENPTDRGLNNLASMLSTNETNGKMSEVVELNDVMDYDLLAEPEKFIIMLLPENTVNKTALRDELTKVLPDLDHILDYYGKTTNDYNSIISVLNMFNYDNWQLPLDNSNKIYDLATRNLEMSIINSDLLSNEVTEIIKKRYEIMDRRDSGKYDDTDCSYLTDNIISQAKEYYFKKYSERGLSIDNDVNRFQWAINSRDNGTYIFLQILLKSLGEQMTAFNIEKMESELVSLRANMESLGSLSGANTHNINICSAREGGIPNIIKYPTIERLMEDNGRSATDSDGSLILQGDLAVIKQGKTGGNDVKVYKRDNINGVEMWLETNLGVLQKVLMDKKNKCQGQYGIKPNSSSSTSDENDKVTCVYDLDMIKCNAQEDIYKVNKVNEVSRSILSLQRDLDYAKALPNLIKSIEKEMIVARRILLNTLEVDKAQVKYNKEKFELEQEELAKSLVQRKDCDHFKVTDYFHAVTQGSTYTPEDTFRLAQAIFAQYLNEETRVYNINQIEIVDVDGNKINTVDMERNYTYCNLCDQQLLCKHFLYGSRKITENNKIDMTLLQGIYTEIHDASPRCKICGEAVGTTEVLDLDDLAKGEDGRIMRTREIMDDTPLAETQMQMLMNLTNKLTSSTDVKENEQNEFKLSIFRFLKQLSNVKSPFIRPTDTTSITNVPNLCIDDEREMINFIANYKFITEREILETIAKQINVSQIPPVQLKKRIKDLFYTYLICDIAVRYLIILQTSEMEYSVSDNIAGSNIIGYPLISDETADNGIKFMLTLFRKMGQLDTYSYLLDSKIENKFVDRLKKQVENDEYIRNKIYDSIERRANKIQSSNEFAHYYTNNWDAFKPNLKPIVLDWQPEKELHWDNLKEHTNKNNMQMLSVGGENVFYNMYNAIRSINLVVGTEEMANIRRGIAINNSACIDIIPDIYDTNTPKFDNMRYFDRVNPDVSLYIKKANEVSNVVEVLKTRNMNAVHNIMFTPNHKPSINQITPNMNNITPNETRMMFLKYIDMGVNKGREHVFDKFGRCILSNMYYDNIAKTNYGLQDYNRLHHEIAVSNHYDISRIEYINDQMNIPISRIEIDFSSKVIANIPAGFDYLTSYIKRINDVLVAEFSHTNEKDKQTTKFHAKFDINVHISSINSQTFSSINELVRRLTTDDKLAKILNSDLMNLCFYKKLHEEFEANHPDDPISVTRNRYKMQEDGIKANIKYLRDIVNQIKNGALARIGKMDDVRPQFKKFVKFRDNMKLFKGLNENIINPVVKFCDILSSNKDYKYYFAEVIASILHYINVQVLNKLFDYLSDVRIAGKQGIIADVKFGNRNMDNVDDEDDKSHVNQFAVIEASFEDIKTEMDEDEMPEMDFIESIENGKSTNIKIIHEFVKTYLDKIIDNQRDYDELTRTNIKLVMARNRQRSQARNLAIFKNLSNDNMIDDYNRLQNLMKQGFLEYKDLATWAQANYGDKIPGNGNDTHDNFDEQDEIPEDFDPDNMNDSQMQGKRDIAGLDKFEQQQMAVIVDADDYDGDYQDYDMIAVGED